MKKLFRKGNLLKSFALLTILTISSIGSPSQANAQALDLGKVKIDIPSLPEVKSFNFVVPLADEERLTNEELSIKFFNEMIEKASTLLGIPYRMGGTSKRAFDCSGFTSFVFKEVGIKLPRTSTEQSREGETINKESLRPGDLIFFNGRGGVGTKRVGHVGIVMANNGNGDVKFIHSARGGVQISNLKEYIYYKKRYVVAKRFRPTEEIIKNTVV